MESEASKFRKVLAKVCRFAMMGKHPKSHHFNPTDIHSQASYFTEYSGCHHMPCACAYFCGWTYYCICRQTRKQVAHAQRLEFLAIGPAVTKTKCILNAGLFSFVNVLATWSYMHMCTYDFSRHFEFMTYVIDILCIYIYMTYICMYIYINI